LVREYGDQKEPVAAARVRLVAMEKPASGPNLRLIGKDSWVAGPSPDGRFLLQTGANWDLDLRDLQTGQIRHIAKSPWADAVFSPDGRQVAFSRYTKDSFELRIVGADGSAERLLWQGEKGWGAFGCVWWFPDGKRIMVPVRKREEREGRLVAISASDGAVTVLWEGKPFGDSQLSPDGKSVVYARRIRDNPIADELWLLRLEDRSETLLFEGQSIVMSPLWTPDGAGVVFLSDRRVPGTTLDLWLLRTSGGKPLGFPELVKTGLGEMAGGNPTIFPSGPITRDGTYYFHREPSSEMVQLLTTKFDPDTGKVVGTPSFVSRTGGTARSPSFSHDGRWLSYVWQGPGAALSSLVIRSVESGEERAVTPTANPLKFNWALMFPDGQAALVNSWPVLYKLDVASGVWTSLKKPGGAEVEGFPSAISPDARTLYYSRPPTGAEERYFFVARDIETGQERELFNLTGMGPVALSHDGKQLALTRSDGNDMVIDVLPAAGGPRREVHRVSGFQAGPIAWTPEGRYLIFGPRDRNASRNERAKEFFRVPVEGGEAQPVGISASRQEQVQFPRGVEIPRVHPNGRQLVYGASGAGPGPEDWALENFLPKPAK
jgi:Tol biopolymer transport system component